MTPEPGSSAKTLAYRAAPRELSCEAVLLTVCGDCATRHSVDGRHPIDNMTEYFDAAVYQVRASRAASPSPAEESTTDAQRVLESDDLTILTGWAQALAEALAYAPECVESLLADACGATPWRAKLDIPEPSRRLDDTLRFLERAVFLDTANPPILEAVLMWCLEPRLAESGLDTFVRQVLRLAIEQVRARQAQECCGPEGPSSV
jgi:hypothetical protein